MGWLDQHSALLTVGALVLVALLRLEHRLTAVEVDVKWIKRVLINAGFTDGGNRGELHDPI